MPAVPPPHWPTRCASSAASRVGAWCRLALVCGWLWGLFPAQAQPLHLTAVTRQASLEGLVFHLADPDHSLSFETVQHQPFERLPDFRSLGYSSATHWFRFGLSKQPDAPRQWIIAIGMPALEKVDVWIQHDSESPEPLLLGYHRPFAERPLPTRLFAIPVEVAERTQVYVRVRTTNAVNFNAQVWQPSAFVSDETVVNFQRGLYFGVLLLAVALYAILGGWMRDAIMLAYAGYIASQTLLHMGSAGYLPVMVQATSAPWLTDVLPRIGWLGGAISIVVMWDRLLTLRLRYPWVHRLYVFTIGLNLLLVPFALMPFLVNSMVLAVVPWANYLNSLNFGLSMTLLAVDWWRSRRVELMVYFLAFVIPALGSLINIAANQGALSQNVLTSNVYQLAPLVHVLVMSLGLAIRLRQMQRDKATAEQSADLATQRAQEQRRFVAMLSHEFRNPLSAIDRSTQMLAITLPNLPEPESRRLAQIRTNVATLSGFVDNFLVTEALDHGALALSREPTNVTSMLDTAVRLQSETHQHRVHTSVTPPEAVFTMDPTLIGVAVGNLLTNALRYSPPGSPVELSASLQGAQLCIRVADLGPGLSASDLEHLGTPYFRATSALGKKGSGLGYHFTQRIVHSHQGTITAQSPQTGGLEVCILLPG